MRVLFLAQEFPNSVRPAACSFLLEQAKALNQHIDIVVVAPVYEFPPLKRYEELHTQISKIPECEVVDGITIYHPRYQYLPGLLRYYTMHSFVRSIVDTVKNKIGEIDLIHGHFAHAGGYAGLQLRAQIEKPLIVTVHGSDINRFLIGAEGAPYLKGRSTKALQEADAIIAVSNDLAQKVQRYVISDNIHTIYNGVDLEQFFPVEDKNELKKQLSLPAEKKVMLFVGNIIESKGIFDLIKAWEILMRQRSDLHICIIGYSEDEKLTSEIRTSKNISYIGELSHDQVIPYMQAADLLVHPSYSEGFGLVVAESLACGCPVVCSKAGALPELITGDDVGLCIEAGNIQQLADTIIAALSKQWSTEAMVQHARQFSMDKNVKAHLSLYKQLLSSK